MAETSGSQISTGLLIDSMSRSWRVLRRWATPRRSRIFWVVPAPSERKAPVVGVVALIAFLVSPLLTTPAVAFVVFDATRQKPESAMLATARILGSEPCQHGSIPNESDPNLAGEWCARAVTVITYWIDVETLPLELASQIPKVRESVRVAMKGWEGINWKNGKKLRAPITFVEAATPPNPVLDPDDGITVISWNRNGAIHAGGVGHAFVCCNPDTGAIALGPDIYLDGLRGPWVLEKRDDNEGTVYLPSVLAHEIGHTLGRYTVPEV